jgi:hypothetical protein
MDFIAKHRKMKETISCCIQLEASVNAFQHARLEGGWKR